MRLTSCALASCNADSQAQHRRCNRGQQVDDGDARCGGDRWALKGSYATVAVSPPLSLVPVVQRSLVSNAATLTLQTRHRRRGTRRGRHHLSLRQQQHSRGVSHSETPPRTGEKALQLHAIRIWITSPSVKMVFYGLTLALTKS